MKTGVIAWSLLSLSGAVSAQATSGTFSVLSFNIAGLPPVLNDNGVPGDKATNARIIGQRMKQGPWGIINVQEDFAFNKELYSTATFPYRTRTSGNVPFGSGLNTLSLFPFTGLQRVKWNKCFINQADCLTPKGFTFLRAKIANGVYVDVYNLHGDAGDEPKDTAARASNVEQVVRYIAKHSAGNAVLVYGDTNTRYTTDGDNVRAYGTKAGLTDAWVLLEKNGVPPAINATSDYCPNPTTRDTCEVVDKVFFRSSPIVKLTATDFHYADSNFLSSNGSILSDHNPVSVKFTWSQSATRRQSDYFGGDQGPRFNDIDVITDGAKPSSIDFRGANRLDAVSVSYGTKKLQHGGSGGSLKSLALAADEYWTSARLCQGKFLGMTRLFYIKATTSKSRTLEAGKATDDCQDVTAPAGWQIGGFAGRAALAIDQLSLLLVPQ